MRSPNTPIIYQLIDCHFLKSLFKEYSQAIGVDLWQNLQWERLSKDRRTFVYDSLPSQKPQQTDREYVETLEQAQHFQNQLGRLDNIFVKNGTSRYRKRRGQVQKGVDILLAVDAVNMASRGVADEIHIFTSDLDFFPVFETLQQTACRGRILHHPTRVNDDLILVADFAQPINMADALRLSGMGWGSTNGIYSNATLMPVLTGKVHRIGRSYYGSEEIELTIGHEGTGELKFSVNSQTEYFCSKNPWSIIALCQRFMRDYSLETDMQILSLMD